MKPILRIMLVAAIACLTGCATAQLWWVNHKAQVAQTAEIIGVRAAKIAGSVILDSAISSLDREKKQDFLDGLAGAFYSKSLDMVNADDVSTVTWN